MIYFLTALGCLVCTYRAPRGFWWAIAGILILIGLSSLSDLPQYLTMKGRAFAYEYGWYRARRPFQTIGVGSIPIGSIAILMLMFLRDHMKHLRAPEWLALIAIGSLLNLILIRAISLHDIDYFLGSRLFDTPLSTLFEFLILLCIVGAAFWAGRLPLAKAANSTST